jgi:hypothetical protein
LNSQVYPNPTTDKLIIDVAEPDATWQLINTMGQVVSAGSERELVVNHLPRGLYILQISSKLKRATHRVILQ